MTEPYEKIGFIGAGNMAEAVIAGVLTAGHTPARSILVSDIQQGRVADLEQTYGVQGAGSNKAVVEGCDTVFFAVKPQQVGGVLSELAAQGAFRSPQRKRRIVSIAAGIRTTAYEAVIYSELSENEERLFPIIRVMPNTPALVLAGTSAVCANSRTAREDLDSVKAILSAVGEVFECRESEMNAVTAVSGSGPAYGFYLVEAMRDAGAELGLPPAEALKMTVSTLKGALALLENQQAEPDALRRNVTSPGGTTEAALQVMDAGNVQSILKDAIKAAARRAGELSG
jgi:pyrroline-5-carboxylate reductase